MTDEIPDAGSSEPFWIMVVVALFRFAPGAILGAAFGFYAAMRTRIEDPLYFFLLILVIATLFGWAVGGSGLKFEFCASAALARSKSILRLLRPWPDENVVCAFCGPGDRLAAAPRSV